MRDSVYADAGFDVAGPELVGSCAAAGGAGGARPSRSAFSFSALSLRSSLSASIFALILAFAAISSCFSLRLAAASLSCSFFFRSSLMSCASLVLLRRISYRSGLAPDSVNSGTHQLELRFSSCLICPARTFPPVSLLASASSLPIWPSSPPPSKEQSLL